MALSGYEKQKRWREKNRALYNFQQRQRRNARKNLSGGVESRHAGDPEPQLCADKLRATSVDNVAIEGRPSGSSAPPAQKLFETKKVGEFRMVVLPKSDEPVSTDSKPLVFRNDYGNIISERAWNKLQEMKQHARENNFVIDDYSQ